MNLFENLEGFEWDRANVLKNWIKHKVSTKECEEVFFNEPLVVVNDEKHSQIENRYLALGATNENRLLSLIFTLRSNKIRIISARDQNKKERSKLEKNKKNTKIQN